MHANLSTFAAQPIPAPRAMKSCLILIAALLGALAGKIAFANHASTAPAQRAAAAAGSLNETRCFQAMVELDEGYGVTGRKTRWVCEKAG